MKNLIGLVLAIAVLGVNGQMPSVGWCPEYLGLPDFDMEKFAGTWYEAERYFQLSEVASRCVKSEYTRGSDNKFYVLNEVTSRFTGIKRILEGEIRKPSSKQEAGKLHVKYTTVPVISYESQYTVLDTDYKSFAVLWSCSGIGPVNTQNAWVMTRQRIAPGDILQKAYAVLDKYKISKLFFVKTNQEDCAYLDNLEQDKPAVEPPKKVSAEAESNESEETPHPIESNVRSEITPDAPEFIIQTRRAEIEAKEQAAAAAAAAVVPEPVLKEAAPVKQPIVEAAEPIVAAASEPEPVQTVPEVILKIAAAEQAKQEPVKEIEPVKELEAAASEPIKAEIEIAKP